VIGAPSKLSVTRKAAVLTRASVVEEKKPRGGSGILILKKPRGGSGIFFFFRIDINIYSLINNNLDRSLMQFR
jgi:hypothetical protein